MPSLETPPNDPELFGKLVDGMTSLIGNSHVFFNIDNVRYAYPEEPDNIRRMEDSSFTLADAQGRNADGRTMSGDSLEPDNVERMIFSWLFNETARQQYGRIGELVTACMLETPEMKSLQVDLYWVEQNGTVWTRTEARFGKNEMTAEERKRAVRRQLTDFELDVVGR